MYSASTIIIFAVALVLMLGLDARLTAIALVPLPFVSISVRYFGAMIHRRFEAIQAQLSDLSAVVQEALAGVRVVRAYRQEGAELERFALPTPSTCAAISCSSGCRASSIRAWVSSWAWARCSCSGWAAAT